MIFNGRKHQPDVIAATTSMSSCDSTVIAFKQDELCFHALFYYQKSSESDETAIVSCKNCHDFNRKVLEKPVFSFDPCIISNLLIA